MRLSVTSFVFALFLKSTAAAVLPVGAGQPYPTLAAAVAVVQPGDTIEIHAGTYSGGLYFDNLQGTSGQWITIRNAPGQTVIFEGGSNAIQLTDPAYLHIRGLIFQHQTGNGFNTDDGGTYDTPAHHLVFEECIFRDMSASGNNDLLKLSGLDHFEIRNCQFLNGAAGGSGVDMVGCHHGVIRGNHFEDMGSNAIQCKGGSEWVRIEANFFRDCGQRTLNLGGSTGLQFFRPDTAHFEAANLQVYANIIVGSVAPVAYVGSVNVEVVNNTIYRPGNWVVRILQETVDPDRFLPCGDNTFRNNIVYIGNLPTETNVGPNTAPETFVFSNNLWFNADNANWGGPDVPVNDLNNIINEDPLLADPDGGDFSIPVSSPAAGAGFPVAEPQFDYLGQGYAASRSIGAVEAAPVSATDEAGRRTGLTVFPNPSGGIVWVRLETPASGQVEAEMIDPAGRRRYALSGIAETTGAYRMHLPAEAAPGVYLLRITSGGKMAVCKVVIVR